MTALLSRFGTVRAARSLDEAQAVMASGFDPEVVVSDLNLGDRRPWHETFEDVVRLAHGRPIAAQTADVWPELREDFARRFSGKAQLFSKMGDGPKWLVEWLQQMRHDQSGSIVRTMDSGSHQSHVDIRLAIREYLRDLGVPHPVDDWIRDLVRCIKKWQARAESAWKQTWLTLLTTFVGLAVAWATKVTLGW